MGSIVSTFEHSDVLSKVPMLVPCAWSLCVDICEDAVIGDKPGLDKTVCEEPAINFCEVGKAGLEVLKDGLSFSEGGEQQTDWLRAL